MYCGDETGSFVGDVGSHLARFGYGGEDTPKHVVPSYVTRFKDDDGNNTKTTAIPTSCYNPRFGMDRAETTSVLRMAKQSDPSDPIVVDPVQYLQQGDQTAQDWEAYEHLWQNAFDILAVRNSRKHTTGITAETTTTTTTTTNAQVDSTTLRSTAATGQGKCEHPLLVVTPGCTHRVGTVYDAAIHRKELMHITELMMETMDCRALFVAPTPMLAAFCYGRQTALVVDIGAAGTRVTPIVDGLVLKQSQRRNGRGGDWLGNISWKAISMSVSSKDKSRSSSSIRPRYQLHPRYDATANKTATSSRGIFHRWAMQDLMYEFRTNSELVRLPAWAYDPTIPFMNLKSRSMDSDDDDDAMQVDDNPSAATYELPDGTKIDLSSPTGKDLCRLPELLFTEETPFLSDSDDSSRNAILQEHSTLSDLPLHQLIHNSLSAVGDVDVRKELANNIVLCGGSSLLPGLEKRISLEVTHMLTSTFKPKVLASKHSVERSCAAWIGGSILTNLGSFQQLWLSKDEYDEYGATLAVQRFP